ncbi:hypothetical protein GIB67_041249 [Kingdonia uniflora]|uniref:NAC domain-containing protein n=1 Tax=Kingdonia uniflora TaxID=39325 RepID=A0A7J7LM41_9MAGN|nr:hypothetical protein GIB67_041249 [Kingdonia uniflora]
MSLSVNGQSQVPPGFRFHPTEEELLHYYLKKKVAYEKIDLDVIRDVDLNKLEPWDIQERCKIGSTPQNDWYFFSHKDKKYPTGTRTNRATTAGFWKATGRDKVIYSNFKRIGMRKTLVFYRGRAPHGQKSDWIMHEYRLDDNTADTNVSNSIGEATQEDGWVVCRVFKKKNHHKTNDSPNNSSKTTQMLNSSSDGALDQILQYMGRSCKQESETVNNVTNMRFLRPNYDTINGFMQLPALESPTLPSYSNECNHLDQEMCSSQDCYQPIHVITDTTQSNPGYHNETDLNDWGTLDRLVASHLNVQAETTKQLACLNVPTLPYGTSTQEVDDDLHFPQLRSSSTRLYYTSQDYSSEIDLWNFTRSSSSSSDPLYK